MVPVNKFVARVEWRVDFFYCYFQFSTLENRYKLNELRLDVANKSRLIDNLRSVASKAVEH